MMLVKNNNSEISLSSVKFILPILRLFSVSATIIFLLCLSNNALAIDLKQQQNVNILINTVKTNNRIALSRMISYPLLRQSSLPPINNSQEFLKRYDQVFDNQLIHRILTSNASRDWVSIGWQGVILQNGIVALDPEGKITDIHYQSPNEVALFRKSQNKVVAKGRRALHRSVNNYENAVVDMSTPRFHIRVDKVGNGQLRYTSWSRSKKTSDKPDLVLGHGRLIKGNGRNNYYVFDNGSYSYQLNIDQSKTSATASLEVFKSGQRWSKEDAINVSIRR